MQVLHFSCSTSVHEQPEVVGKIKNQFLEHIGITNSESQRLHPDANKQVSVSAHILIDRITISIPTDISVLVQVYIAYSWKDISCRRRIQK